VAQGRHGSFLRLWDFINAEGNGVTRVFLDDVTPLIGDPLPIYARLDKHFVKKLL
jgi:hypothetical protein